MPELNENRNAFRKITRLRRPILLSLIFWVFVLWTLLGWVRFTRALAAKELITSLLPPGLYWTIVLIGLFWGLVGLAVLWGLTRGTSWTPKLLWIAAIIYPALYWIERLFLWKDANAQRNWPFMLLLTGLWIGLVLWAIKSKPVKQYFKKAIIKG